MNWAIQFLNNPKKVKKFVCLIRDALKWERMWKKCTCWFVTSLEYNYQMVCLAMELYYYNYYDNNLTKFISFVKYFFPENSWIKGLTAFIMERKVFKISKKHFSQGETILCSEREKKYSSSPDRNIYKTS